MVAFVGDPACDHREIPAVGVLVSNVGTPDAPSTPAVRRYLRQFLSDPRVVEGQGWAWKFLLHGVILRVRPRRSAALYRKIFTEAGSPLLALTQAQAAGIEARLHAGKGSPVHVAVGMRYGRPSIAHALDALRRQGCRRILIFPLFPQYAGATVGSVFDAVVRSLRRWRWVPELRFINHYHDDTAYLDCLARSVREQWQTGGEPERLLISFHGMPEHTRQAGDPYHGQCLQTARLLAEELELPAERWQVSFQSRFGRTPWLSPRTDATLEAWGRKGVGKVDVIAPGFAADCLETTEEIAVENRTRYLAAGGERYRYIAALNDREDHLDALTAIAARHLLGWLAGIEPWDARAERAGADARARRTPTQDHGDLNV